MTLIESIRAGLRAELDKRAAAQAQLDELIAAVEARGDANLTVEESAKLGEFRSTIAAVDAEIEKLEARKGELEDIEARNKAAAETAARLGVDERSAPAPVAHVMREERTYNPDAERRGVSFLSDVFGAFTGDFAAGERLSRHRAEERVERPGLEQRAVGTGAFAGLTVPQYLTDLVAPNRKAGRVLADLCTRHPLPATGMNAYISRVTTGSGVTIQGSEHDAAQNTDMDDTLLTIPIQTLSGQQVVSRQALERSVGVEAVVLSDLARAYDARVDTTLITQATTGLDAVTDANVDIAYTDASPTAAELWPKLFDLIQQIQTAVYMGADAFLMHPRRFWWLASQVGTSFPFVNLVGAGPQAGGSVETTGYGTGPSGFLAGLPVYVDANIVTNGGAGTNEDRIYGLTRSECHLWEDDAMFIRAEQPGAATLGVTFVVYSYVAYTFSRYPSANGRIAGTGLVTPTF